MKKNPDHLVSHYEEGVELALEDDKYVFFMESSTIKYITQRKCNLTEVGDFLDHKYYGIAMQKGKIKSSRQVCCIFRLIFIYVYRFKI